MNAIKNFSWNNMQPGLKNLLAMSKKVCFDWDSVMSDVDIGINCNRFHITLIFHSSFTRHRKKIALSHIAHGQRYCLKSVPQKESLKLTQCFFLNADIRRTIFIWSADISPTSDISKTTNALRVLLSPPAVADICRPMKLRCDIEKISFWPF